MAEKTEDDIRADAIRAAVKDLNNLISEAVSMRRLEVTLDIVEQRTPDGSIPRLAARIARPL